jgi:predicted GTPase
MSIDIKAILNNLLTEHRKKELAQNPRISEQQLDQLARSIEERIDSEPPPRIAFIGETGVGKSSTLNALFDAKLDISHTEACTQQEVAIEVKVAPTSIQASKGMLVFYDMPGLGESRDTQKRHLDVYTKVLKDVDVALWILDAQDRAIEFVQEKLANEVRGIKADLAERIVFALNKVDLVHPGETAWHSAANLPTPEQDTNIKARIRDVQKKITEALPAWKGSVIGYSAKKRYRLPQLFSVILDAVPEERQWVLASRKALADFFELVDADLLASLPPDLVLGKFALAVKGTPKETDGDRVSKLLGEVTPEEYAEIVANKEALEAWLKKHLK